MESWPEEQCWQNSGSLNVIIMWLILGDKLLSNGSLDKELRIA